VVFTENSVIVTTWVSLIKNGIYTKENVPKLFNLQEIVYEILDRT